VSSLKEEAALRARHEKLKRLYDLKKNYSLFFYKPYRKQREFHSAGAKFRERLFMAGNQLGKTYCAGNEVSFHVTGLYPEDWDGRRLHSANRGWTASVTSELTRDGAQRVLLGPVGQWGTGCIPKECIIDIKRARGVPDAVETILIKHVPSGGVSQITFKAYSDGREAFQAETLNWVWLDEEPPEEIYTEAITRTNTTAGMVFLTFTPLLGMSNVVMRFLQNASHPDRHVTNMTIEDVEHYSEEQKRQIIDSYPEHEREARTKGIPMLGSGRIFPVAEEVIREASLVQVPVHWRQIIGMDFGWDHPTAAVHMVHDPDGDVIHVTRSYRRRQEIPLVHAAAVKPWGSWVPVAWPRDGLQHDKGGSCEQLSSQYRDHGLNMISESAAYPDKRGYGVEAGIAEMLERMRTGRFKVDHNLAEWFEEFRMYHRKDGQIVKEREDLMASTRYGVMMLRYALPGEYEPVYSVDRYSRARKAGGTSWMSN
jgi:phage terminase large subunit-like protein